MKFLETGEVWFSRADDFGDKMECITIDDLKKEEFPFAKLTERKKRYLISCWHNVGRESIAMWDTSFLSIENKRVYALKFEFKLLIEYVKLQDFNFATSEKLYGSVIYKNLLRDKTELEGDRMRRAAFRKEYSYNYEQEFRLVVRNKLALKNNGYGLKIGQPSSLNFKIMVNPLLNKEEYMLFQNKLIGHSIGELKHQESELAHWLKPLEW